MTKKLGIVGDLHFGIKSNNEKYLNYQLDWFYKELIPTLDKEKCDTILFLGDVYDNRVSLSPIILHNTRKLFKELCEKYDVHVVLGNHDCFYRNTNEINTLCILTDQGAKVYEDITEINLLGRSTLILPWLNEEVMSKAESTLVNNDYELCFGHLEINGFEMQKNVLQRHGMIPDVFVNVQKVFSGHFHIRNTSGNITYVGTPYEMDWGDSGEPKGFTIMNMDTLEEVYYHNKISPRHISLYTSELEVEDIDEKLVCNQNIKLYIDKDRNDAEKIQYTEKVLSLEPFKLQTIEEKLSLTDEDLELEQDIKDSFGAIVEYIQLIGYPDDLKEEIIIDKIKEIHNNCEN
jgi:hypothetical protein